MTLEEDLTHIRKDLVTLHQSESDTRKAVNALQEDIIGFIPILKEAQKRGVELDSLKKKVCPASCCTHPPCGLECAAIHSFGCSPGEGKVSTWGTSTHAGLALPA